MKNRSIINGDFVRKEAIDVGFDACGIVPLQPVNEAYSNVFLQWLHNIWHADMEFMRQYLEKRLNPRLLMSGRANAAVVTLLSYKCDEASFKDSLRLSRCAYGQDYHEVVKKKLHQLRRNIQQKNPKVHGRTFVDSAPIMERYWAVQAGLGWIGKSGMLISKQWGTFTFIGVLLLDAEVDGYDSPMNAEHCGTCNKCMEACPTKAIVAPKVVNANLCISYQTIERPRLEANGKSIREAEKTRCRYIFGCDICQNICPWNAKVPHHNHSQLTLQQELQQSNVDFWRNMNQDFFNEYFEHSTIARTGLQGMKNNVSIALNE
ncbi:MAG: tRNA epoxyqueuosine(34) reductase QueG [Prevotellaceae bacterium]|nr:tRNA epoxyqueuosine(34) reductase QueG [Prevotellaceae bacterium]